jgi:hypothetical protein
MSSEQLTGNTLSVYAYVVKENRPVGTRDVMRGANLSSPSVAHRHLQKLELMGLLEKNQHGDYVLKEITSVNGHVWGGKNLVPRLMFYSFFFMGAFGAELAILLMSYMFEDFIVETSFLFLTAMTAVAMVLFFAEGVFLHRKTNT